MSQDDQFDNDNPYAYDDEGTGGFDESPRRRRRQGGSQSQGMSTGTKVILGVLIGGGVMMLLCCGALFFGMRNVASQLEDSVTDEPEKIADIQQGIADVTAPEGMDPQFGMDFSAFGYGMKMVMYSDQEIDFNSEELEADPGQPPANIGAQGGSTMMLMSIIGPELSDEEVKNEFQKGMRKNSGDDNFVMESSESKTVTIGGEEVDFLFAKGKQSDTDAEYRQVSGSFMGREGPAMILISIPEENWDEEAVTRTIESINAD